MINRKFLVYFPLACFLLALGCTSKTIGTKSDGDERYSEDLTPYRPNYKDSLRAIGAQESGSPAPDPEDRNLSGNIAMTPALAITDSLDTFLSEVTEINRENNTYQGVTIQVYSGLNRTQANEAKTKVYEVLPDAEPRLVYEQPNYKVKVGEYFDRLAAQKDYVALREEFPLVLVVPEKFKVVK